MADDQRQQDHTPDEDVTTDEPRPKGLGRLTARLRRRSGAPEAAVPLSDPGSERIEDDAETPATATDEIEHPDWLIPDGASPSGDEELDAGSDDELLEAVDEDEPDLPWAPSAAIDQHPSDSAERAEANDLETQEEIEGPLDHPRASDDEPGSDDAETEEGVEDVATAAAVITPVPEGLAARPRPRLNGMTPHLVVLTGLATIAILGYLLIEPSPRWMLLLGAAAVVFGLDGTLRQTWRTPFSLGQETAPYLFVPALYMLGVPVLIEHNVSGELVLFVGLGASVGFGALAWAEVASVRPQAPEYDQARLLVTANTYLTGFAIFSLSYVFEISLAPAIVATAIAASMLAVEVLREGEIDPMETLGLSLVTGIVLGELRWLLYYVPLDTYLAGLTLLLAFYLVTGLLHSHVIRALNRAVAFEYGGIAAAGLALVIVARAAGLA